MRSDRLHDTSLKVGVFYRCGRRRPTHLDAQGSTRTPGSDATVGSDRAKEKKQDTNGVAAINSSETYGDRRRSKRFGTPVSENRTPLWLLTRDRHELFENYRASPGFRPLLCWSIVSTAWHSQRRALRARKRSTRRHNVGQRYVTEASEAKKKARTNGGDM